MAKQKNDYFKLLEEQVDCCVEASDFLEEILCNYSVEQLPARRAKMQGIEHKGDGLHHDIQNKLSAEFITPIDQEDILLLVQIIDDVTDALDEVALDLYMFHIDRVPADAPEFSKVVSQCVKALSKAVSELKNFKKPDALRALLAEVNVMETKADGVFIEAIHNLFGTETESRVLIGHKAVYERMEKCCDLCEHAADVIEQVIVKNT